jgi:nickel-dependent lactate racemase
VPQAAKIVERTVATLLAAGVNAHDITLLRTLADVEAGAADPLAELPDDIRQTITESIHDPSHRPSLSYLAASADARPIYIHRAIHDADLVISIGCLRLEASLGYFGIGSCIFPTFSDTAHIDRYRTPKAAEPREREKLRKLVDEVSWLLGVPFTVQVVPGAGSEILHVLAGDAQAVFRQGSRLCDEAWNYSVPQRASLVVATISGDATQQTWENVGRALAAASRAVTQDGAVAICTDLSERLGPALQQIVGADDLDEALREIGEHRPADALPAAELVHALQRGKVYLVSRLDEGLVEDLGVSPVAAAQVSRVAGRYDSCIVLTNAQYALACPQGECSQPHPAAQPKSWK